jgi:hypothetical protein
MPSSTAALLIAITVASGCVRGPVVDSGTKPAAVGGTLSGIVRAAGSNAALSGRTVTATEVTTGARFETSTATNGGYTMKVPRGKYRLEVELRPGEAVAEQPADTEITASDLDASRDFVVTVKPPGAAGEPPAAWF